ncbi:MAG TPA: glutamyl-tRNA reductase [Actinomycetota bacterium]|nr:glutamyl-tRNA reductase [Actinomycetota bacterium]
MSIVVVGLNHKTAPVDLLEQLSISEERLGKALHQLATYEHVLEGALLSTCNRIEAYAVVSKFHGGAQDLRNFFSEFCHVAPEDFADAMYTYHDEGALRHLFRVAAGIDSMVVGESEILGQVRRSYQRAADEGMVHRVLGAAFRQALRVGKRARTETSIGHNPVSVSSAAVELARRASWRDGTLDGRKVTIVGAGKMGRLAAQALAASGAVDVTVVNRTEERGRDLAETFGATSRPFEELEDVLRGSDIVICSTTSTQTVIDRALVERARRGREDEPLFVVDIAVPRDVEPDVGTLPGVVLRDIDDLRDVVEGNLGARLGEVGRVEELIADELDRFSQWQRSTEIAPTAAALVSKADAIRAAEMERIAAHLETMTPAQRDAVDHLSRRMVAKLLHAPLKSARDLAGSKQGQLYLTALRELFELSDEP